MTNEIAEGILGVSIDGDGVETGVAQIVNSIGDITKAANRAGSDASKGIDKIGDGAVNTANNVDRATRNIINSIERTTATIKAGGRGTSAFFESLANVRGADGAVLKPYIEQLKAVEREAEKAALSNTKLGNSAKQTAFALRGIPAQISDIVVSLQGGQAPLTVFLQQGAQLKDMFGGAGNAAKALGGFVTGLINPFTLTATAATALATAYFLGTEQTDRLNKALLVTGNIVGGTTGSLTQAANVAGKLAGNYSLAREAVEQLAGSGKLGGDMLNLALGGVVAGVELTGRGVKELVKDFESIAKEPSKAILNLNEQYNFLTLDIYKQITALEKQGKTQEAATLAAKLYADTLSDRQNEVVQNLGFIERGWKAIKTASDAAKNSALGIGRELTGLEKLAELRGKLNELESRKSQVQYGAFGSTITNNGAEADSIRKQIAEQQRLNDTQAFLAKDAAKYRKEQNDAINQQGVFESYIGADTRVSKSGLVAKQIEDENKAFALATKGFQQNSAEFQQALAAHNQAIKNIETKAGAGDARKAESAIEKQAKAYADAVKQANDFIRVQELQRSQLEPLTAAQKLQSDLQDKITSGLIKRGGYEEESLRRDIQRVGLQDELNLAHNDEIKFYSDFEKSVESRSKSIDSNIQSIVAQTAELELQNSLYGKLPSAITEATIADLNRQKVAQQNFGLITQDIEDQIAALEKFKAAQGNKEFLEAEDERRKERVSAEKKANDEIIRDEKRAAEERSRIIGDSLMRGFERGDSIKKTLQNTLTNISKTLVVRPVIDFVLNASGLNSIMSYVSSLLSQATGGAGSEGGGFGGGSNLLSGLSSLSLNSVKDAFKMGGGILDVFSGGNSAIVGSIEKLGVLIANGNGGIADAIGGFLGANAGSISSALPYAGAIITALQGDFKTAALTAVGTLIGGPIGGFIGGALGGLLGKKKSQWWDLRPVGYIKMVFIQALQPNTAKKDIGAQSSLASLNEVFSQRLDTLLQAFDINSVIRTASDFRTRTNTRGLFSVFVDGVESRNSVKGKAKDANNQFQILMDTALGSTLVSAIQSSKLSGSIKSLFNGVADKEVVSGLISATIGLKTAQIGLVDSYGLTVDRAADAATATGLLGKDLADFVNKLTTASLTIGDALTIQRGNLLDEVGTVPTSLKEFDALLKSIDKSTDVGVQRFSDLFTIRDQVIQFTKDMAGLKGGVTNALLGIVNPSEQRTLLQENLKTIFDDVGLAIPTSIDGLIELGKSIDFTTKEGINLAAVFPSLVSAFTQTKDVIEQITAATTRSKESFKTYAEYMVYQGVAANYGGEFASDFTANFDNGRIVNDASGKAVIAADPNADLLVEIRKLVKLSEINLSEVGKTSSLLAKFDEVGLLTVNEVV